MNEALPLQAFSPAQFSRVYGLSRRTLYNLWKTGDGPPRATIGGRVLIPVTHAQAWVENHMDV